jgi:hypothetical protein
MSITDELKAFGELVRDKLGAHAARLRNLEERIERLERSKALSYRGAYTPLENYDAGDYASWNGSLWHAVRDAPPGDSPGKSASWRLAVKSV